MRELETLSVVALLEDLADKGRLRGQVGTIVERLAAGVYTKSSSVTTRGRPTPRYRFALTNCFSSITSQAIKRLE